MRLKLLFPMEFLKDNGFDFSKQEFEQVKPELNDGELEAIEAGDGGTNACAFGFV